MSSEAEWTEETRQKFLRYLGRHLVALTGSYRLTDDAATSEERPFNYTGCIVTANGEWFVLTAGHAIQAHVKAVNEGLIEITGRVLADYFGINAANRQPIPFDIIEQPKIYTDDVTSGLDYALLTLNSNQRQLLESNDIMPLRICAAPLPPLDQLYRYFVVGFPEERVDLTPTPLDRPVNVAIQPHCVPLQREPDDTRARYPRFRGRIIEMGDLQSIVGLSGGPIFGFVNQGDHQDYYLVAIQSRCIINQRVNFGCLATAICDDCPTRLPKLPN